MFGGLVWGICEVISKFGEFVLGICEVISKFGELVLGKFSKGF